MTPPLSALQRWMQAVVVHPGPLRKALRDPAPRRSLRGGDVSSVILPSKTLGPAERVEIYHHMYPLRMVEAMAGDYPAVQHALGEKAFRKLVLAYVQDHPSRSYTLSRLGDHFPKFILRAPGLRRRAFLHDLARLELAVSQVFDAPESPALREETIAAVPPEDWPKARLVPVEAFRLLAFRHTVNAYLQSVRDDDHRHPRMARKDTWVAVWRRDYAIVRLDLTRPAHDLLAALAARRTLGSAMRTVMRRRGRAGAAEDDVFRWFRQWTSGGAFQAVRLRGRAS